MEFSKKERAESESITAEQVVDGERLKSRKHGRLRRLSRKEFVSSKLQREYEEHVRLAQNFFLKGQNKNAEKEAILALRIRPTAHICALFAAIAESQGEYNRASDFRLLQAFLARDVQLWEELMHEFLEQNLFYKAIICLQRLSALENANAERYRMLQLQLADLFIGLGEIQRATSVLVPLWNSSKCRDFEVFALLAGLYFQLGKWNSLERLVESSLRYAFRLSFNSLDDNNSKEICNKRYDKNNDTSNDSSNKNIQESIGSCTSDSYSINENKIVNINNNIFDVNDINNDRDGNDEFSVNGINIDGANSKVDEKVLRKELESLHQEESTNTEQTSNSNKIDAEELLSEEKEKKYAQPKKRTTKRVRFFGLDDNQSDESLPLYKYKHIDEESRLKTYDDTLSTATVSTLYEEHTNCTKVLEQNKINNVNDEKMSEDVRNNIDDIDSNGNIAFNSVNDKHINNNAVIGDSYATPLDDEFNFDQLVNTEKFNNDHSSIYCNELNQNKSIPSTYAQTHLAPSNGEGHVANVDMEQRQTEISWNNSISEELRSVNEQVENSANANNSYSAALAAETVRNMYGEVIVLKSNTTRRNFLTLVNVHTELLNERGRYWETIRLLEHTSACLQVKMVELPPDLLVRLATAYAFIGDHNAQCKEIMQYVLKTCLIDEYGDVLLDAAVNLQKVGMYEGAIDIYTQITYFFEQQLSSKMSELDREECSSNSRKGNDLLIESALLREDVNNIKIILSSAYNGHAHCMYALSKIDESYILARKAIEFDKEHLQARLLLAKVLYYHKHKLDDAISVLTPNVHEPVLHRIQLGIFLVRLFKQANKYVESVALGVSIFDLILNSFDDGDNESVAPGSSKRSTTLLRLPSMSRASSAIVAANTLAGATGSNSLYGMSNYVNNSQNSTTLLSMSMAASIRASSSVFQQQHNRRGQGALTTTIYGSSAAAASRAGSVIDKDDKSELSESESHQDASFIFRFHRKRKARRQSLYNTMKLKEENKNENVEGADIKKFNSLRNIRYNNEDINYVIPTTTRMESNEEKWHDNHETLLEVEDEKNVPKGQGALRTKSEVLTTEKATSDSMNSANITSTDVEHSNKSKDCNKNCENSSAQRTFQCGNLQEWEEERFVNDRQHNIELEDANMLELEQEEEEEELQEEIPSLEEVSKKFDDPVMAALFLNISTQNPITMSNVGHDNYKKQFAHNNAEHNEGATHQERENQEKQEETLAIPNYSDKNECNVVNESIFASNIQNDAVNLTTSYDSDINRVTTREVIAAIGQRSLLELAVNIVECYSLLDKFTEAKEFASVAVSRFAKRKLFRQMGNTLERPLRLAILRAALTAEQSEDAYRIGIRLLQEDSTTNERNEVFWLLHSVLNKCEDRSSILYRLFMEGACDVPLIVLLANRYYQTRSFSRVLNLYLIALKERPNDALLNFLVGLTYLLCSHQKPSRQREGCVSAGMYYLNLYQSLLIASNVQRTGEAMYNCARALQYLRVFYLCIPLYREIAFSLPIPSHCTLTIKHAAELNLYWIYYHNSGNRELALASLPRLIEEKLTS